jgi:8-oxo-dGTP diphosphatase
MIENQRVLITQRANRGAMAGKWEFPGGKIEPGETPEVCLQRELQEELGIQADIQDLYVVSRHAYPQLNIELLAYKAAIRAGQITLHDHQAYYWTPIQDLGQFDFSEADHPIVQKLLDSSA